MTPTLTGPCYIKKCKCIAKKDKNELLQRAKKVVCDSPGLMDFAIRLVIFVLNLPKGQVLFWGELYGWIVINPANQKQKGFGAS